MPLGSSDIAECYADASLAKKEMGFECAYGLKDMCEGHEVVGYAVGIFAYSAALVRPYGVEVSQQRNIPTAVRLVKVAQHILYHELGSAVRIGNGKLEIFLIP